MLYGDGRPKGYRQIPNDEPDHSGILFDVDRSLILSSLRAKGRGYESPRVSDRKSMSVSLMFRAASGYFEYTHAAVLSKILSSIVYSLSH